MSKTVSQMPEKLSMADGDFFTTLDSEDPNKETQNKKVQKERALSSKQPVAPAGNQLGVNGGWTAAGDSATRNVGTGSGDVAAGDAPSQKVGDHESSFNHSNLPTTAQKGAMDAASSPSGANPFATMDDLPAGGSTLHADLTDTDTDGHPGTVITITAGVQGNAVSIAADGTLQDSGTPPGGTGTTDLSNTPSATEVTVESSSGQDTSIAPATQTLAGVLSAADKTTLDGTDAAGTARPPTAHAASHEGGADAISPAGIGAATAAQGALADSAIQPGDNADTLGSGAATNGQVLTADGAGNSNWGDVPPANIPADVVLDGYVETPGTGLPTTGTITVPLDGRIHEVTLTGDATIDIGALPSSGNIGSAILFLTPAGNNVSYAAGLYWAGGEVVVAGAYMRYTVSNTPGGNKVIDAEELATV